MSDISDLSPKTQELYRKIMSGKYLTEQSDDIPLPMRRYFCQALHLVRGWFESHQEQMKLYCMNNTAGAIAILKEMEKNPDELMKGDFAEFPVPEPFNTKFKKKANLGKRKKRRNKDGNSTGYHDCSYDSQRHHWLCFSQRAENRQV